jgi:hypothetical protein
VLDRATLVFAADTLVSSAATLASVASTVRPMAETKGFGATPRVADVTH